MALTIPVAHDFICPWCWVGFFQAKRLEREFGVKIDWRGYELFPPELEWPDYPPAKPQPANKPATPSRLDFLLAAEDIELPHIERPKKMRTTYAHQAVEYAKEHGGVDALIERFYRAYWEEGRDLREMSVLRDLARGIVDDLDAYEKAIKSRKYRDKIVAFDDDAYSRGVYNVPTFFIGRERLAEQPYTVLAKALKKAQEEHAGIDLYTDLEFPAPAKVRPYVYLNMVASIDGKIVAGSVHEGPGLGSKTDQKIMRRLEASADAVIVGASTLRTAGKWNPATAKRIVVTKSGDIPHDVPFFTEGQAIVATSGSANVVAPHGARILRAGGSSVDLPILLERLRGLGIRNLLVLGGSELNAQFLRADLVDELFLTVAPKIKLGRDLPTIAGGEPLPKACIQDYELLGHEAIGSELFLRYRRKPE